MSIRVTHPRYLPSQRVTPQIVSIYGAVCHPLVRHSRRKLSTSAAFRQRALKPTLFTASRILPYPTYSIFKVIADINTYPQFLPYVRAAEVIATSPRPDSHHNEKWPALASLTVGFQDKVAESYTSRVFCAPPVPYKGRVGVGFVEALSGSEAPQPTFTVDEDVSHYDLNDADVQGHKDATKGPLAFLRTRWTVAGYPHKPAPDNADATHNARLEPFQSATEQTNVNLAVEFRFESAVYDVLGQAASGKVADVMIDAFEKRVREIL
ncbi:MAG: hypothetical protein Q9159_007527 [Coniocarpon cinnabarinum]